MPWINHLPPVCWSTFGILVWNDSGYVNLTQWWYFFIIFEYILHISTPHIMVFCFPLPYFPLSTSALFFAKYSCTHIVYRRSLVTFYYFGFFTCFILIKPLTPSQIRSDDLELGTIMAVYEQFANPLSCVFNLAKYIVTQPIVLIEVDDGWDIAVKSHVQLIWLRWNSTTFRFEK